MAFAGWVSLGGPGANSPLTELHFATLSMLKTFFLFLWADWRGRRAQASPLPVPDTPGVRMFISKRQKALLCAAIE
jgi:hypothetical protein